MNCSLGSGSRDYCPPACIFELNEIGSKEFFLDWPKCAGHRYTKSMVWPTRETAGFCALFIQGWRQAPSFSGLQ